MLCIFFQSSLPVRPLGKIHITANFLAIYLVTFTCLILWFSKLYVSWACFKNHDDVMSLCERTTMVRTIINFILTQILLYSVNRSHRVSVLLCKSTDHNKNGMVMDPHLVVLPNENTDPRIHHGNCYGHRRKVILHSHMKSASIVIAWLYTVFWAHLL